MPSKHATKRRKLKLYRKTWPKIRKKGSLYEVDGRRRGTAGKQEYFDTLAEAEKRATAIEMEFSANGNDGLAMPLELRSMAFQATAILKPFGRSIVEAAQFYRVHLEKEQRDKASAIVSTLADDWVAAKEAGTKRKLRQDSIRGIRYGCKLVKAQFGSRHIASITRADINRWLAGLKVADQTKQNYLGLFSQFFNWCVEEHHVIENPCDDLEIEVASKDVVIWTPSEAESALRLSESEFPEFILFHAISLFAGLRPLECRKLEWENVHLDEKQIVIPKEITKVKETRLVPITDTLFEWLDSYAPPAEKRQGLVVRKENFSNRIKPFRAKLGYRYLTRGEDGEPLNTDAKRVWEQDVMRHSFGSYWLRVHQDRPHLAEMMGNSPDVIKHHYKRIVLSESDARKFWEILPAEKAKLRDAERAKAKEERAEFEAWDAMSEEDKRTASAPPEEDVFEPIPV